MTTAAVLRKIRAICDSNRSCSDCPLDSVFCGHTPLHWSNEEIEEMADVIDDYEEDEDGRFSNED